MIQGMRKIIPFLWFPKQAEEAAKFYVSVFKNSKLGEINKHEGNVVSVAFELDGNRFVALNGARVDFTEAVSFLVPCKDQQEIDTLWNRLLEGGGRPSMCGWLKDRFAVSWQIVPEQLEQLLRHPKAVQAMLKMQKLDVATLEAAAR